MSNSIKLVLAVFAICNSTMGFADDQYQKEKNCVAAYSLARDFARNAGDIERLKALTAAQNKIYLARPSGYFKPKHIDTMKFLYKQRIQKNGASVLNSELANCGWKEDG
jgi:hypothetical protein